ncbi:F-box protein At3g54460 isoform X1 [Lycium barbarum]|uniref:F-box protein At3g54460 isoform X1 n=1 Tax=Lycium barbarum TaxID=112863 RepID=UPI00293E400C|nr:F-box protein At3g54460 isoform X1 [Lycium barbarum]XP_060185951.1 F-box protein At3g54460 isoform X1 [Lycium barbarum]XP_060185952.1 F-box protein At3g54460 isoform X1 [Lycium barbarum]
MEFEKNSISDHKLCGYFLTSLKISSPSHYTLPLNSQCYIAGDTCNNVHFISNDNVVLSPIEGQNAVVLTKKKKRSGRLSVVQQLHKLVRQKCLKIVARVVEVVTRGGDDDDDEEEVRVVVMVDVYLPIALWSGWQFPKSGNAAAALFRHVSCDWEARSSMLQSAKLGVEKDFSIWNLSDCHVVGCKLHCSAPDPSKKKLFELHEIFKSLPSVSKRGNPDFLRVNPLDTSKSGIWVITDDILINILSSLSPVDLLRVSATCRHLRSLAASIMPCMKLKLFAHQQAAVDWMLQRERNVELLQHPLYMDFVTEDGFAFYINAVSGQIATGQAPTIKDFHGGMFCDEPGLGKTITALSLILKTQGTLAEPPDGAQVMWCMHNADQRCGYYELCSEDTISSGVLLASRATGHNGRRGRLSLDKLTPTKSLNNFSTSIGSMVVGSADHIATAEISSPTVTHSTPTRYSVRCTSSYSQIKRDLMYAYEGTEERNARKNSKKRKLTSNNQQRSSAYEKSGYSHKLSRCSKRFSEPSAENYVLKDTWIQCDACHKWRRLAETGAADTTSAWFCSMNTDSLYQSCSVAEDSWDHKQQITCLPGFHSKGTPGGLEENISFFTSVLKDDYSIMDSEAKKALIWLAKLSPQKLLEMETIGLVQPIVQTSVGVPHSSHKIFQAFGLVKRTEKGTTKWYYPRGLVNLVFDLDALRVALCKPLDSFRLYLSRATLVVVPSNLVDHWRGQIERHVRQGQLRVFVWADYKRPSAHSLAWDYDVVITTFSRLSAEWSPKKRSVLMQVHWLRIILDEGHTLGSSLSLTNKLQMAVSLRSTNRWLLTGTPTPNTPSSQLSHLQPLLKFLHDEAYGQNHKVWEAGILRPFEAEMEEGRSRLLQLLHRCMISARKKDLQNIPPCIKKVTLLNFTEEHATSYNELVETVRRNILMADWNDPSHVESLLNPKQWKFRSTTIRNVRLSCCVAGHVRVTEAGDDIQDTMDILVEDGLDTTSEEYALIKYLLLFGGNCMRCKAWCRLPVITPCKHLLCLDCVSLDSEKCTIPGCGNLYEMQSPETLARPENPNPKWPVPKDLIELQPSYKQDDWNPDWQSTSSSKVAYLVDRLKEIQEANRMIITSNEDRVVETRSGSHACTGISNISTFSSQQYLVGPSNNLCSIIPQKVIIFSQFLEHIHVIEQQLAVAGISFASLYSPMPSISKVKALATFQHDVDCMALLMDGSAALGLDLSFVTHVYLMEPIWDKSMEEQVISRAHRMGATRPILVETLAMSGTIEEQMLKFLQEADEGRRLLKEECGKLGHDGARAPRTLHDFAESNYLAHLNFVRTSSKA